jgi:hypothetical protein
MAITLSQATQRDRFDARHWMFVPIERASQPPNPPTVPYRGCITLSGVAIVNFKGESDWQTETFILDLTEDLSKAIAIAPYKPAPGRMFVPIAEQWTVFATVNTRSNEHHAVDDGSGVDSFWRDVTHVAHIIVNVAMRDVDAFLIRIGYQLSLLVALQETAIPG